MIEKPLILIVDDEQINVKIIHNILKDTTKIIFALNGNKAVEMMEQHHPDLVLMDIMMPGIDGFQTAVNMKKKAGNYPVPIIFITALQNIENKKKAFDFGGVDYITKPIIPEEVLIRVHAQLTLYQQKKELIQANLQIRQNNELLESIMNSIDALIFVSKSGSGEILFMNRTASQIYGSRIGENIGKVFLPESETSPAGEEDSFYIEFQCPVNQRWYYFMDRHIIWFDKSSVLLQIGFDITGKKKIEIRQGEILKKFRKIFNEFENFHRFIEEEEKPLMSFEKFGLTARERQIAEMISEGLSNSDIASKIYLSESTVKKHVHRIYQQMHVRNRIELFNIIRKYHLK